MRGRLTRLTVYSASHFLVDFGCALLIFRTVSASGDPTVLFILYNYCAFALQMPVGLLADKLNRNALMAAAGCALVALGCAFSAVPLAAAAISGVGNALFHVGGGVDVLDDSEGKASSLGVFVSPGAAGLFLGTMLGKGGASLWIVNAAMALAAFSILLTAKKTDCLVSHNAPVSFKGMGKFDVLLPALCLFFVVIIRSFAGMTMGFAWKGEGYWGVAALAAVVLGKTAGGFAMDRIGGRPAALLSLAAAGVLFWFADSPYAGVAAIFLFNMSMPMTLCALARRMPGCKGFSFGLLTFALFLGFLPVGLGAISSSPNWLLASLCALSALLMLPGLDGRSVSLSHES